MEFDKVLFIKCSVMMHMLTGLKLGSWQQYLIRYYFKFFSV